MNPIELNNLLQLIQSAQGLDDNVSTTLLKLVMQSISAKPQESPKAEVKSVKFTKKELSTMPKKFQQSFIYDNKIVKYRYYEGLFQARYRRDGFCIEIAAKSYEEMKQRFIAKLNESAQIPSTNAHSSQEEKVNDALFSSYGWEWLKIKEQTTKPSTYKEYKRSFEVNLVPTFGHLRLSKITRSMVQEYLLKYVEAKKFRTAEKLKLQLTCIFDMAAEDFGINSPMKKIVLPYHESKKGSAFTKEEERTLVEYCQKRNDDVGSALLVLLYFGLRQSELVSLRIIDGKYLECETSKERMGRNVVLRKIPFTAVAKRYIPFINFEKAKAVNIYTLRTAFKRLFPNHHPHELRYTFITRCKECHVNPELVMLWGGHSFDKDVRTSEVDRGYTDYSEEYILAEAEKVNYTF